jgi:hypothetical protein
LVFILQTFKIIKLLQKKNKTFLNNLIFLFTGDALKICTVESILTYYDRIFCSCIPPTGYENTLKLHLRDGGRLMYPASGGMCVVIEKQGAEYERREVDVFSAVYTYPLATDKYPRIFKESDQSTQLCEY